MWHIYCDESRVDGCKYMLIGALSVPPQSAGAFAAADKAFRAATKNDKAHFKWVKATSKKKLPAYLGLIDLFFAQNIFFKCIVIEKSAVDYKRFHRNDHELGFYKFYYLLLSRLVKFNTNYFVRIHRRPDKNRGRLVDLEGATNNWCRRRCGRYITPIQQLEAAEFENHTELQLVDVLLGAVGYHWERAHLKGNASPPKVEICKEICKRLDKASLEFESDWRERKFNLWKWKPK